ncbi:MAG: hypothetical protein JJU34_21570 [Lunatimonas sp.]|uniref:hypothetical protein n=1 Tax=Lunatimonas sp. TaxID=2060141 RepID=UPI00263B3CA4|nr:hypothetical protein [Lunatimonas sp.]MCC5939883.1 hypothetical protein [Lunatimonas sp.]
MHPSYLLKPANNMGVNWVDLLSKKLEKKIGPTNHLHQNQLLPSETYHFLPVCFFAENQPFYSLTKQTKPVRSIIKHPEHRLRVFPFGILANLVPVNAPRTKRKPSHLP